MTDPKEVLELCKKATPGWRRGNIAGTIVTDAIDENVFGDDSNREYYGGSLVAESIHSANRDFAILARNVLPELAQRVIELEAELARLQVALEATIAEKGKYKRALKIACEVNSDMFATSEEAMIYCIRQATGRP